MYYIHESVVHNMVTVKVEVAESTVNNPIFSENNREATPLSLFC